MTRGELTTMYRADHYEAADRLVARVRRQLDGGDWRDEDMPSMALQVAAAQVHATLAAAPREVEEQVKDHERAVFAAVVSAEETRVRLLGGSADPVVESPANGTEPTDDRRARATTCRCTGQPHDLGAVGCSVPGMNRTMGIEETAGTVRPKPGPPNPGRRSL